MWDVHAQRPCGQTSHRLVLVLGWRSVWHSMTCAGQHEQELSLWPSTGTTLRCWSGGCCYLSRRCIRDCFHLLASSLILLHNRRRMGTRIKGTQPRRALLDQATRDEFVLGMSTSPETRTAGRTGTQPRRALLDRASWAVLRMPASSIINRINQRAGYRY